MSEIRYVLRKEFEWMSESENLFFSFYVAQLFNIFFFEGGGKDGEGERRVGRTRPFLLFIHPLPCCQNILDIIYALMTKCKPNMAGYRPRSPVVYWNPKKKWTNGANMQPYKLGQQRVYHWAKWKKCLPGTKQAILHRQESLAAMLVSPHRTAATWHLQTTCTFYKFRCKISLKLSESHEKLHSLKKTWW